MDCIPDKAGLLGIHTEIFRYDGNGAFLVGGQIVDPLGDGANELLGRLRVFLQILIRGPESAADAGQIVARPDQDLEACRLCLGRKREADQRALDGAIDQRRDPLRLALEADDIVIAADIHVEELAEGDFALVVVGAAGAAIAESLAL